jgi:hypothetical protein
LIKNFPRMSLYVLIMAAQDRRLPSPHASILSLATTVVPRNPLQSWFSKTTLTSLPWAPSLLSWRPSTMEQVRSLSLLCPCIQRPSVLTEGLFRRCRQLLGNQCVLSIYHLSYGHGLCFRLRVGRRLDRRCQNRQHNQEWNHLS